MERQPYNQSDSSKSGKESGTSRTDGFNFAPIPITPSFERAERPAPAPRPVEVPLEGVINWRHDEDLLRHRPDFEKPKEAAKEKREGDNEDDDDSDEDSSTAKAKQVVTVQAQPQHLPTTAPRPLAEVIAEVQAQQSIGDNQEAAEAKQDDATVPQAPVSPLHTFPSVAPRVGEYVPVQATVEDDDATPAPSSPAQQPAPQPVYASAVAPANVFPGNPNNVNIAPQPVAAPNPNLYPGVPQPNQANNAPNVPPMPQAAPQPNMAGNFNQPPMGPGGPGYNYNQAPYNPYNPAYANYNMMPGVGPNAPTLSPNAAPAMPIERPVSTSNHDPRVPAVAALLGAEYIFRKRADRKLEKRVNERADDQQAKLQERISTDNRIMQERQRQFATEQQRQADELQRMRYGQEYTTAAIPEQPTNGGLPRPFEAAPSGAERFAPATRVAEARPMGPMGPAERNPGRPEVPQQPQAAEQQAGNADTHFDVHPDQRVEHSAWHNIVVDEHGHEVAGAIQYGEGFKRERQQEVIRDRMADSGSAAGGGVVAAGSPMQDQYGSPMLPGALPSGVTNPALPQGQPTHANVDHQLQARNKQPSNLANPWFWIMLALIVAAFFTAATV